MTHIPPFTLSHREILQGHEAAGPRGLVELVEKDLGDSIGGAGVAELEAGRLRCQASHVQRGRGDVAHKGLQ